jgi:hypothetical protein
MNYVADFLEMPRMRVYEVATFYTMFHRYGRLHEGAVYMEARLVCLARESGKWLSYWAVSPSGPAQLSYKQPLSVVINETNTGAFLTVPFIYYARLFQFSSYWTFHNFIPNRKPVGKHVIQLCTTTPCMLCGAEEHMELLQKKLGGLLDK